MPRLRNPSIRTTRQSINRNPDAAATTPFRQASPSSNAWAPPEVVAQNLSRLSDSPLVPAKKASPSSNSGPESSANFKSFIGDFFSGGKNCPPESVEPSPRLMAAKFQFKTASISSDVPPELQRTVPPSFGKRPLLDDSGEVIEHELIVDIEDETPQRLEDGAGGTKNDGGIDYDLSKSPFRTQTNPIPSPSPRAPKVFRGLPTAGPAAAEKTTAVHVIDSDELPPRAEDDPKEFRFDETQQPPTAPTFLKKSFTQDIVTGFLNTQSDFFETQMGKTVDEECFASPKKPPMLVANKFRSIGTMTDPPVGEQFEIRRQPLTDKMLQQRESLHAIVNNLNRANAAIVRLMGQIEKVCGSKSTIN